MEAQLATAQHRRGEIAAYALASGLLGMALWPGWLAGRAATEYLAVAVSLWLGVCLFIYRSHLGLRREREARALAARGAAQSERLSQLTAALGRAGSPAAVIEASVQESLYALRADAGMLLIVSSDRESASIARTVAYDSSVALPEHEISLLVASPMREAVQRGVPLVVESHDAWRADYAEVPDQIWLSGYAATALVPLTIGHRVIAIVRLDFRAARRFTPLDRECLMVLGSHAAQALDRAWQYEAAQKGRDQAEALRQRANEELVERQRTEQALRASETRYRALAIRTARMHELIAALSEAVTVKAVASAVVERGSVVVGATAGSVSLLAEGFEAEAGLCATEAIQTARPVFVASWTESQERYWRSASLAADAAYASSAALPLLVEGTPIGALELHFNVPVNFDADYEALLVSVAQHCSQALDRARLYEAAQRARADAESANRLKDDFLSIVSHELRTPLNAVVGWASMLRQRSVTPENTARATQSIYDNAMRQARLIDDLLDVSRMATGQAMLDREEIDLSNLITGVVESVMAAAASDQVDLSVRSMPSAVVMGDRRRLEQVFFNLLGNAVKFTPAGGQVTIEATCVDHTVELRVRDTGEGIEPSFLPHVFDRFRQGDSSPTRSYGGLGLGLSIAKQFVEAHGGAIAVESAGRGLGSTFTVTLPLAARLANRARPADQAAPPPKPPEAPRLDGISVLVVDDEPDAREVMGEALTASGARVTLAATARDAFGALVSTDIDVLLADIAMPGEDGYSLIRRVRACANARIAAVPAAAVTAHAWHREREEAFAAGFQQHLAKPIEPAHLVRVVDQLAHSSAGSV